MWSFLFKFNFFSLKLFSFSLKLFLLLLKLLHYFLSFCINLFLKFFWTFLLSLLNSWRWCLLFIWYTFSSILKLKLRFETFGFNPIRVIVVAGSNIFVIHKSFKADQPWPFFITIFGTEIELIISWSDFKSWGNHFLIFSEVWLIGFDLFQIDYIGHILHILVRESVHIIGSQNNPSFTPLLQEFTTLVQWAFTNLVIFYIGFNCLWIHIYNIFIILINLWI